MNFQGRLSHPNRPRTFTVRCAPEPQRTLPRKVENKSAWANALLSAQSTRLQHTCICWWSWCAKCQQEVRQPALDQLSQRRLVLAERVDERDFAAVLLEGVVEADAPALLLVQETDVRFNLFVELKLIPSKG